MTCQHPACTFHVFSSCMNHCMKHVCLKHLMEHGDVFLQDYTNALDQLDRAADVLTKEVNSTTAEIMQRRDDEIEQINRKYNEDQQKIRNQLAFVEAANQFFKEKQQQLIRSKEKNECLIAQHDFEQLKCYIKHMENCFSEEVTFSELETTTSSSKTYPCPLTRPDVFGIKECHRIRFNCRGPMVNKYNLLNHLEGYHRMLPESAARVRDAVCRGQDPDQTKLFSENEIILNGEFLVDCPLIDPTNIFGARSHINTLVHFPCTRKQITITSMQNHLTLYHRMKYDVAKTILQAMKSKTLRPDSVLFEVDQRLAGNSRKK